jgi:aminopeptidase N
LTSHRHSIVLLYAITTHYPGGKNLPGDKDLTGTTIKFVWCRVHSHSAATLWPVKSQLADGVSQIMTGLNMLNPVAGAVFLKDYAPPEFLISTIDLDIDIRGDHTTVCATMAISRNPSAANPVAPLLLDGDELRLESVCLDGRKLSEREYTLSEQHLSIPVTADEFSLQTRVRIDPEHNTKLMGVYASKDGYFTQCEAEGFRRITFFPDRPDVMARYTTTIHADKERFPVLLSNGNRVDYGEESGGQPQARHWANWQDPFPKPSYLFALVAVKLD